MTEIEFPIDLNALVGDKVSSHIALIPDLHIAEPYPGQTVVAVDEDDARYLAVIESIGGGGLVRLRLKLESKLSIPSAEVNPITSVTTSLPTRGFSPPATVPSQGTSKVTVSG